MQIVWKAFDSESKAIKYANKIHAQSKIVLSVEFRGGVWMVGA